MALQRRPLSVPSPCACAQAVTCHLSCEEKPTGSGRDTGALGRPRPAVPVDSGSCVCAETFFPNVDKEGSAERGNDERARRAAVTARLCGSDAGRGTPLAR